LTGLESVTLVVFDSQRQLGETLSQETRYFIISKLASAEQLLAAVRLHWGIENQWHWVLDMSFGEDQSRIRKNNAPINIAIIRHAALNRIRKAKNKHMRVNLMRKSAGWNDSVLHEILAQVF
jgi:predicted transposase YbfD/YdcC